MERIATLQTQLERSVDGDVRFDKLSRTLYSTDASIYEITPEGVVLPRNTTDVVTTVNLCRQHGVPIVPRGAGTGLAGGAVGGGIQLDCSRYMTRISDLDTAAKTVRVQAGVVLDELNALLAPHGLHFAPDVATSSRATIGGMIANNSCGAHSIVYGRTCDHIEVLTVVVSDGSIATWPANGRSNPPVAAQIEADLTRIAQTYRDEVAARFPKVLRRNGGYALDRLCGIADHTLPETAAPAKSTNSSQSAEVNPAQIICGSEGTLCVVTEAVLRLAPLPRCKGLLVVHFRELLDAMGATPTIIEHKPAAIELVDWLIIDAALQSTAMAQRCDFVDRESRAMLIVEFFDDSEVQLSRRIQALEQTCADRNIGHARSIITQPDKQADVWNMRTRGLGLLMSRPGDAQPYAFVEDSAVDPSRLRDYIDRFGRILVEEGIDQVGYYAHASVGLIHVRPALNLKSARGVSTMKRIADRVSDLAVEFAGAMTGEHGDGIVRSCWLEKMYGAKITQAFEEVKRAFDPCGLFNPGKIVDPWPMTENLRHGAEFASQSVKTHLDFKPYGGLAGLSDMCSGVGQCRQRLVGTMCPSFMATGDETHTTRARANALRIALSNRGLLDGLDDPALDEVMDLCLLCKACKTECPTGVDMARMKVEWLAHRNRRRGVSRSARFMAEAPKWARRGSRFPRLSNLVIQSTPARMFLERRYGLDRRMPLPRFAQFTFRRWFDSRKRRQSNDQTRRVVYFLDTWTNYYTPQVGIATVKLLEAAGFRVIVPHLECCGRPLISKGLLGEAEVLARRNIERLAHFADRQIPIVGSEPSCILTLVDEYPQLVDSPDAREIATLVRTVESFLAKELRGDTQRLRFAESTQRVIYHAHCHQKAMIGSTDAMWLLNLPPGMAATEINSGCCGMAGSFGHEKEHYEVARQIGEQRLFPAVRDRDEAQVAVSGFSCRHQIAQHTGTTPRHVIEMLADRLNAKGDRESVELLV